MLSRQNPIALSSLLLSVTVAYLATLRPFLRRPILKLTLDEIRCSQPTVSGESPSWFVTVRVENVGLMLAREWTGRPLSICTHDGAPLPKFDPLTLYWARHDHHTGHTPLHIQGHSDVDYLDVLQVKPGPAAPIRVRAVIPEPMTLSRAPDDSPSPGTDAALRPGVYWLHVGVFAENAEPGLAWLEVTCEGTFPANCDGASPCLVRLKGRPPIRAPRQ